ncbi:MAG: hypothetical protein RLZZ324_570 [Candidatus Parcubacteria bacterium]
MGGLVFGEMRAKPASGQTPEGAAVSAMVGKVLGQSTAPQVDLTKDVDFQQFWDVWKTVKAKHVYPENTSDKKLFYGAIAGMVGSLGDPYSVYFDPEFAQKFNQQLEGTFDGIGAEIGIKSDTLTVIAPLPGTPAEKAGIKAGDRIYAIDGTDTTGMSTDDAVTRIRGKKGTQVKLLIGRDGLKDPKEIVITRSTIVTQAVKWETKKLADGRKIGVITLSQFNDQVDAKFNQAVKAMLADDVKGIVLDLRNDPGGYLDAAVTVAGEWIHEDTVVIEKYNDGKQDKYPSKGLARLDGIPTVVLINGGSASASEIVAGALQDDGKALLIGEKSFGKGSVQDYSSFDDGSALKLTVALWYTPKDRSINKAGIEPDVKVGLTTEDFNANKDPQMSKAMELLGAPGGLPKGDALKKIQDDIKAADAAKAAAKKTDTKK